MDEFIKSINSISWWFGVVFVGLILNILSTYIKEWVDSVLSKISLWWRKRSNAAYTSRILLIADLRNDKHKQVLMLAEENRNRQLCIFYMTIALVCLILYVLLKIRVLSYFALKLPLPNSSDSLIAQFVIYWGSLGLMLYAISRKDAADKCKGLVLSAQ